MSKQGKRIRTAEQERADVVAFLERKGREDECEDFAVWAVHLAEVLETGHHEGEVERQAAEQAKADERRRETAERKAAEDARQGRLWP